MEGPEGAAGVVFSSLSTRCEALLLFPVVAPLLNTNSGPVCEFSTTDSDSSSISPTDTMADIWSISHLFPHMKETCIPSNDI